jgi:Rnl2 family RNA ligase
MDGTKQGAATREGWGRYAKLRATTTGCYRAATRVEHRPYPRIETAIPARATVAHWIATEKVHGANLVVATDGRDVRIGKRKAWLRDDEALFGWQLLRATLGEAARGVWRSLGASGTVRLHGELYGGAYPHAEVAAVPGNLPVQTGVWYAPDVRFSLFDVQVEGDGGAEFLAHRTLEALAAEHGIEAVPVLGRGARGTLEQLPVRFPTRVPALHGLPPIAGNVAEGFVLKPDARMPAATRPAVKRKIPEFDDARFDDGEKWDPQARLSYESLHARAASLMNPMRVAAARSKVGPDDVTAQAEEAALDAMVDLEAAFPAAMEALEGDAFESLRASLETSARTILAAGRARR